MPKFLDYVHNRDNSITLKMGNLTHTLSRETSLEFISSLDIQLGDGETNVREGIETTVKHYWPKGS